MMKNQPEGSRQSNVNQKQEQERNSHADQDGDHDHAGPEIMFRNRFWVSLALTVPVLLYSETIQRLH